MARPSSVSITANKNVTPENLMGMLQDVNNWKKTKKNIYSIYCTLVQPGVQCYNEFEDVHYTTNENQCVILSGTRGEQCITTLDNLAKTYYFTNSIKADLPKRPIDPSNPKSALVDASQIINGASVKARAKKGLLPWTEITTLPSQGSWTNYCFHLPLSVKNFPVKTSWGETLIANRDGIKHGVGDFILCSMTPDGQPNINDVWVVNGEIFADTYNKKNIQGLASGGVVNSPKPTKEYIELPKKANLDTVVSSSDSKSSRGAKRKSYDITARYIKGRSTVAYEIKDETGKTQVVDKDAVFWLVGRGQINGVTVQMRADNIALLGKDGFSIESIESRTIGEDGSRDNAKPTAPAKSTILKVLNTAGQLIKKYTRCTTVVNKGDNGSYVLLSGGCGENCDITYTLSIDANGKCNAVTAISNTITTETGDAFLIRDKESLEKSIKGYIESFKKLSKQDGKNLRSFISADNIADYKKSDILVSRI